MIGRSKTPFQKRMRNRKAVSTVLVFSMLCTLAPAAIVAAPKDEKAKVSYTDVSDKAWYKDAVNYVSDEGLLVGVTANKFGPDTNVTRAMVAAVMWRQCGAPKNDGVSDFADVDRNTWYSQAVTWGAEQGLVAGYGADKFGPNDPVTREQLVSFIQRFSARQGEDTSVKDPAVLDQYSDTAQVGSWSKDAMAWALENKVISGVADKKLAPRANASRAQYAAILMRIGATIDKELNLANYSEVTYYHNGEIITVDEKAGEKASGDPISAKAVLVGDGYILAVAYTDKEVAEIEKLLETAEDYQDYDLQGTTMIPAFVDAHSHIEMVDQNFDASPSAGVTSLQALIDIGKQDFDTWVNDHEFDEEYGPIQPGGKFWFVTNGFDNTAFKEAEFGKKPYAMPTKEILDEISTDYPIVYIHASSHLGALNSLAMQMLEQAVAASPQLKAYANPDANWDKDANGEYTGIVRESGFYVLAAMQVLWSPQANRTPSASGVLANAMDVYASNGIATGISGSNGGDRNAVMAGIPEDERILDMTGLIDYAQYDAVMGNTATADSTYNKNGVKHGAVKLFLDGSPQGKTAWFQEDPNDPSGGGYYRGPDETVLTNEDENTKWWWGEKEGKKVSTEQLTEQFTALMKKGVQFHAHANGTAAIQQYIDAYRNALVNCGVDLKDKKQVAAMQDKIRAVIIHSQTITQKQLKECKELGLNISFFTDHVYYYGDYHMFSTLGPVRGQIISPMADALADGMDINVTMHQDSPVAPPNMLFSIFNAANRITRDGQPIGRGSADGSSDNDYRIKDLTNKQYDTRDERVEAYEAMKCVTINSAWQNFEEEEKGSISVGKQADFAVLSMNPLSGDFLNLAPEEVQKGGFVIETINNDRVIYAAE